MLQSKKENAFSPLQIKNKLCDRETDHAFIIGSMNCTVANIDNSEFSCGF
jgi:hypothetical protein